MMILSTTVAQNQALFLLLWRLRNLVFVLYTYSLQVYFYTVFNFYVLKASIKNHFLLHANDT